MKHEYPMRLNAYLARSGQGSRRSCEALITSGRVKINMKRVTDLATRVEANDIVMVDDVTVEPVTRAYYYALNKPRGYVCTNYDPNESLYARDLIETPSRDLLFNIGRLDRDSSGLVLFTNDGQTAQRVMHPSHEIEKEYMVRTDYPVERQDMEDALRGVRIDGVLYTIRRFELYSRQWTRIILTEGKNREIRRIFEYFGYEIKELIRIRIGCIEIDDLKVGHFRTVTKQEIEGMLAGRTEPLRPRREGRW
jgi:23S rRNA pseudouridine2605 synthase